MTRTKEYLHDRMSHKYYFYLDLTEIGFYQISMTFVIMVELIFIEKSLELLGCLVENSTLKKYCIFQQQLFYEKCTQLFYYFKYNHKINKQFCSSANFSNTGDVLFRPEKKCWKEVEGSIFCLSQWCYQIFSCCHNWRYWGKFNFRFSLIDLIFWKIFWKLILHTK